jgi:ribonuclease P protein subunit RPR2
MTDDPRTPAIGAEGDELSSLRAQLMVFARELAMLYRLERERSRELERALQGLRETYLSTMKVLAQVVEAKDATTRGHLDRTQAYGMALARRIDPALADRPELAYGFFLHDIGKVGIPESILRKRGPLSDDEWEVMRSHPALGARIVEPMRFLGEAALVIRHHHERFDGTGYPAGLRGEAIPLPARIFAVADAFDAMTSDRPYRAALPRGRALQELALARGTQFDPDVVDVFVGLVHEEGEALEAALVAVG